MVSKMCAADWIIGSRSDSAPYPVRTRIGFAPTASASWISQIVTIFDDSSVSVEKYGWFRHGIYVGQFEKLS